MTYECAAYRLPDDELMVTGELTVVLVDLEGRKPIPIPDDVRDIVRAFEGADLEE
jgi:acyl-CoA thioesterase FadM